MQPGQPPAQVPGYELERFLGWGAYGEVWVAIEQNTGRRVAIKFYTHRGGLDWSLLSREVEKLAFLFADRYVVQLIGVGWDAEPPYYIMEYLDQGSLAARIDAAPLPVAEAVEIFRDVAVGLLHAHGKGVLHCDLKPANVLLDQDLKPRLADFGQSRLSHEQVPALGTLFYMAPEQADLDAVPDARWDVYALGALLYCMLTRGQPYRTVESVTELEQGGDLRRRLTRYRRVICDSPRPTAHRQVPGVDRALAEILERCLAVDPKKRYPNVQAVLAALDARNAQRARRPMMILGGVGPPLMLLVVSLFAWAGFSAALHKSEEALVRSAQESNQFAARSVARAAANEFDGRYRAVEQLAASEGLQQAFVEGLASSASQEMLDQLSDPGRSAEALEALRGQFQADPRRKLLQRVLNKLVSDPRLPHVEGWFLNDARGVQVARVPEGPGRATIGKNFGWRTYFTARAKDQPETWRPGPEDHLRETTLSAVFQSQATGRWMAAISHPVFDRRSGGKFLGVVALMVELGQFVEFPGGDGRFAVLVDARPGDNQGLILQHPLYDKLIGEQDKIPERFTDQQYRVGGAQLANEPDAMRDYRDPLAADPEGSQYDKDWLAQSVPVRLRLKRPLAGPVPGDDPATPVRAGEKEIGLVVIVQEAYDRAIGATLAELRGGLVRYGLYALVLVLLVVLGLWGFSIRMVKEAGPTRASGSSGGGTESLTPYLGGEATTESYPRSRG